MSDRALEDLRKCFQPRQWFVGDGEPNPFIVADEDSFMWVYRPEGDKLIVGYYAPDGTWFAESSYTKVDDAAARVNYLNGGKK